MDISNRITRDINIYNGTPLASVNIPNLSMPPIPDMSYGYIKIIVGVILIILLIWYLYNSNISNKPVMNMINNIILETKTIFKNIFTDNDDSDKNKLSTKQETSEKKKETPVENTNDKSTNAIHTALNYNTPKYVVSKDDIQEDDANSPIQNSSGIPGWCYIGNEQNYGVCSQVSDNTLCESGQMYKSNDDCKLGKETI